MQAQSPEANSKINSQALNNFLVISGLIFLAALSRLLPHPPNFTPLVGISLFAAARLEKKWQIFFIPLAALLISDAFLGFHSLLPVVYLCFAVIIAFGLWFRSRQKLSTGALVTLGSSLFFFFSTNLAVWATTPAYPKTAAGLGLCLSLGIPFFWNTLAGDVFYTALLFGSYAVLKRTLVLIPRAQPLPKA